MSVMIIKEIDIKEMPNSCQECPLCGNEQHEIYCELPMNNMKSNVRGIYTKKRHHKCPLIDVKD